MEEPNQFEFGRALRLLRAGNKVRLSTWPKDVWIKLQGTEVHDNLGQNLVHISTDCFLATDWELYHE